MRNITMKLPELNCLKPNKHTTFKKLVEEIAECNKALEDLKTFEDSHNSNWLHLSDSDVVKIRNEYKEKLNDVLGEIMDIAQVCASQLFVFERLGLNVEAIFKEYAKENKLEDDVIFYIENNCRYAYLPKSDDKISIQSTMNKIILSMGNIAQLGKFIGENGETPIMEEYEANKKYIFSLINIIQNCFNLLFSMESKYHVNIEDLFTSHLNKLIKKGYCKF